MYCIYCGKYVEGDGKICPECASRHAPQPVPVQPVQPVQQAPSAQPVYGNFTLNTTGYVPPKKKKKTGAVIAIIAALVVVLGIAALAASGAVSNLFGAPKDPDAFFQYVEQKNQGEDSFVDTAGDLYALLLKNLNTESLVGNENIKLHLDDSVLDLIAAMEASETDDLDLHWLSDISMDIDYDFTGDQRFMQFGYGLGDTHIMTVSAFLDMVGNELYLAIPEINSQYLKYAFDPDEVDWSAIDGIYGFTDEAINSLPDEKTFEDLLCKYRTILLSCVHDVEKTTEEVTVGDITQKLTVLKANVTAADVRTSVINMLKEALDDAELRMILQVCCDLENMGSDDEYGYVLTVDDIYDAMNELLSDLEDLETGDDDYAELTTYVDKKNKILGRSLLIDGDGISYLTVWDGDRFASKLQFADGEDTMVITGSGTEKKDIQTASYTVTVSDTEMLTIQVENFDTKSVKKDSVIGTVRILPDSVLIDNILYEIDEDLVEIVGNVEPGLEFVFGENTASIRLLLDGDEMLSIAAKMTRKESGQVRLPDNAVEISDDDTSAMESWMEALDLSTVIDAMRTSGVPEDIVSALEELSELI